MFIGLEIKHFFADYVLQSGWMIRGKLSLSHAGGYVHAAIHVAGTAAILKIAALPASIIILVAIAEFIVHFVLDFGKARIGKNISSSKRPHLFWMMIGLDQLLHHLTYVAIIFVVVAQMEG
jgi:hypothetical protein